MHFTSSFISVPQLNSTVNSIHNWLSLVIDLKEIIFWASVSVEFEFAVDHEFVG